MCVCLSGIGAGEVGEGDWMNGLMAGCLANRLVLAAPVALHAGMTGPGPLQLVPVLF